MTRPFIFAAAFLSVLLGCSTAADFDLENAVRSTVVLANEHGGATGAVIGHNLILTAKHVVKDEETGELIEHLKVTDSEGHQYDPTLVWISEVSDLAIMYAKLPAEIKPLPVACFLPKAGDSVVMLGHPLLKIKWGFAFGHVSSDRRYHGLVPMDLNVLPGDSGGPVFDQSGEIIGVVDAVLTTSIAIIPQLTGYSLMVPTADLCKSLPHLG
jgi:serine protease Do